MRRNRGHKGQSYRKSVHDGSRCRGEFSYTDVDLMRRYHTKKQPCVDDENQRLRLGIGNREGNSELARELRKWSGKERGSSTALTTQE